MNAEDLIDVHSIIGANNDKQIKKKNKPNKVDREQLLVGYSAVPKMEWKNLNYYAHVRYLRKNGLFRPGGYIKNIWKNSDESIVKIELTSNFSYNSPVWNINLNDIETIWKKDDGGTPQNNNDNNKMAEKIQELEEVNKNLVVEIQKINNEQKRILNLIRKLNQKIEKK